MARKAPAPRVDPVVICSQCKKGFHVERRTGKGRAARVEPGCGLRACECWCRTPAAPVTRSRHLRWDAYLYLEDDAEFVAYVHALRLARVQCRQHPDTGDLVWKPPSEQWPPELAVGLRRWGWQLVRTLGAATNVNAPRGPLWRSGGIVPCCCCGFSTGMIDPLGWPRHPTCGLLIVPQKLNQANLTEYVKGLRHNTREGFD